MDAIKAGASYFLEKPIEADGILTLLDKAIERKDLQAENIQLKQKLADRFKFANIIGKSKKMQELFELIENVAGSDANILIQGENGTGKELVANAIYAASDRVGKPFVKVAVAGTALFGAKPLADNRRFSPFKAFQPEIQVFKVVQPLSVSFPAPPPFSPGCSESCGTPADVGIHPKP